jgi:uncharacterized OB-fold protein
MRHCGVRYFRHGRAADGCRRRELLVDAGRIVHRYPTCWRCSTPLLFRVVDDWFISCDEIRQPMLDANATVEWTPAFYSKRMDDWLRNMGDWNISRKRYFGLPLPFYPCEDCGTLFFPRAEGMCKNPACFGRDLTEHRLSNVGKVWSYTDARYQPPEPYVVPGDEHEPFVIAAVELEAEAMLVMGQMIAEVSLDDMAVGMAVELVIDTLFVDDTDDGPIHKTVWKWRPATTDNGHELDGSAA